MFQAKLLGMFEAENILSMPCRMMHCFFDAYAQKDLITNLTA
jgi:hypothetical protein